MVERGLGSVTAPEVLPALSSTHVLTTKVRVSNPNPNPTLTLTLTLTRTLTRTES